VVNRDDDEEEEEERLQELAIQSVSFVFVDINFNFF
jgi:hypothetical protein